ncbi:MAG: hypothetical protein AAGD14_00190 [Planctomycetota bacterium]
MRSALAVLLLAATLAAQGGRGDSGKDTPLILFTRSASTSESKEIYDFAWKALEPYFGRLARERLYTFGGDPGRASAFFARHRTPRTVVCFDEEARKWAPDPKKTLLVQPRADRREVAVTLRLFRPLARTVMVLGDPKEKLPGFEVVGRDKPADVAWVTEDFRGDVPALTIPLLSTSPRHDAGVTVRPDPRGVGLQLAARILHPDRPDQVVSRHRVVVDIGRTKVRVPLRLLARADVVRRPR